MKTRSLFSRAALPALLLLTLGALPARASFHVMQIEQVIGGVNGDTTAQAIQLRMRIAGQNLVSQARLMAYDAAGANPVVLKDFTTNVSNSAAGSRVLIASANFANYTSVPLTPDFTLTNLIPASYLAAGRITFESDAGVVYWSLSFGGAGYTGSTTGAVTNDSNGDFGPSFSGPMPSSGTSALQFQGAASAPSTTNAANYALTSGAATFVNNAGASAIVSPPELSINDVTVTEGDSGTQNAVFTVTRSGNSNGACSVHYATADGTTNPATAPDDYTALSDTVLSFSAGETGKTITVTVNGDGAFESDETFFVNLSSATNATIADAQGLGTITNDDAPFALSVNDVAVNPEGNSGTTTATFTVSLSSASSQTVTVDYTTANDTATSGSDYTTQSGTLTFLPGKLSKIINVPVFGDVKDEADTEQFFVNLSNANNGTIADGQGVGTITDDDAPPAISINDVQVAEGVNGAVTSVALTLTLSAVSGREVTVDFNNTDGTATSASGDYNPKTGTVKFHPGQTTKQAYAVIFGDKKDEDDETFFVNLLNPGNATIGDSQGMVTIQDDDPPPTVTITNVTVTEGNSGTVTATFTVKLSAVSSKTVTVDYATEDDTALSGSDYAAASGQVKFNPGQSSKVVSVSVMGDSSDEANETFFVNLSNAVNASIGDTQGIGTITDDDGPLALSEASE